MKPRIKVNELRMSEARFDKIMRRAFREPPAKQKKSSSKDKSKKA